VVINDVTASVSFTSNSGSGLFASLVAATNYNWVDKISVAWASVKVDGDEEFCLCAHAVYSRSAIVFRSFHAERHRPDSICSRAGILSWC